MKNEERLIEVMAELMAEVHDMKVQMVGLQTQMISLQTQMIGLQDKTYSEIVEVKNQQAKTNAGVAEIRLSFMAIIEKTEGNFDLTKRVKALEDFVYRKAS